VIKTVVAISLLRLWNNKHELLLIFLVPILFFSIFALIFSRGVSQEKKKIRISFVSDDVGESAKRIIRRVLERSEIKPVTRVGKTTPEWPIEKLSRSIISQLNADVVVYFPENFSHASMMAVPPAIQVVNEGTNPLSTLMVQGLLTQAVALEKSAEQTPSYSRVFLASTGSRDATVSRSQPVVPIESVDVFSSSKHQPKIAMYAAGIAVMFILFSANGAGASLLEEKEAGTLERLLTSRLNITQLMIGKWIYIALLGFLQLSIMFAWGQLVFDVDLTGHLPGFVMMGLATTSATASFALLLAAVCRSRNQLNGVSVVLVLSMSAVGGSMIPRYIMSESMQRLGRFTFNGWALDGFKRFSGTTCLSRPSSWNCACCAVLPCCLAWRQDFLPKDGASRDAKRWIFPHPNTHSMACVGAGRLAVGFQRLSLTPGRLVWRRQ
jgi:ABC-2 type transport system permease protein